jgi:hypothetical protein
VVFTDADGHVGGKTQDLEALRSGDEKMHSIELRDMRAQVYESTAIATGVNIMRWSQKGHEVSGSYRFTDTWVKRTLAGRGFSNNQNSRVTVDCAVVAGCKASSVKELVEFLLRRHYTPKPAPAILSVMGM